MLYVLYLFILFKDQSDIKRLIVNDIYYNIKLYAFIFEKPPLLSKRNKSAKI